MASSQWLQIRIHSFESDVGLMRHCEPRNSYCGEMEKLDALVDIHYAAWFRSIQALYLLHCLGMLFSTVMYILYAIRFLESKGSFRVLTAFNFLALAAGVYSVTMFGMNHRAYFSIPAGAPEESALLGYGFYMAITGCCISLLAMLFSAMEASHAVDLLQNMQNRLTVWTTPYTLFVDQEA
ncbi:hypothetical protein BgiMline_035313 [Biomphalaria glabrata]|nr:hypothetical protein BgiMline_026171 [Biomphalaria glabrata]KAI8777060.1 hypothetical protein BgiBS90_022808 [Biomphalaria glabrata]